jgi:hypothetical protein
MNTITPSDIEIYVNWSAEDSIYNNYRRKFIADHLSSHPVPYKAKINGHQFTGAIGVERIERKNNQGGFKGTKHRFKVYVNAEMSKALELMDAQIDHKPILKKFIVIAKVQGKIMKEKLRNCIKKEFDKNPLVVNRELFVEALKKELPNYKIETKFDMSKELRLKKMYYNTEVRLIVVGKTKDASGNEAKLEVEITTDQKGRFRFGNGVGAGTQKIVTVAHGIAKKFERQKDTINFHIGLDNHRDALTKFVKMNFGEFDKWLYKKDGRFYILQSLNGVQPVIDPKQGINFETTYCVGVEFEVHGFGESNEAIRYSVPGIHGKLKFEQLRQLILDVVLSGKDLPEEECKKIGESVYFSSYEKL